MAIHVTTLTEADIPGAVQAVQQAFAGDPYNTWVYDQSKRYYIWKEAQAKAQKELWTDPRGYYFLNIMVVLPEAQGKGVGAKMMKMVTDHADAEDMKCYLESSKDVPNMAIYGRWGFKFQKEMICDDDGDSIRLFTMIREPHAEPGDGR
ncbi:hypothetical protein COL940_012094 [Colletotrichum noveboracense]|nr:hypothetical protein COL940_012094 [Colletotrichum noveboracense]KAJ0275168.1 hypothetical protein CBS470a_011431 [Colletotrichum nupharicola]